MALRRVVLQIFRKDENVNQAFRGLFLRGQGRPNESVDTNLLWLPGRILPQEVRTQTGRKTFLGLKRSNVRFGLGTRSQILAGAKAKRWRQQQQPSPRSDTFRGNSLEKSVLMFGAGKK